MNEETALKLAPAHELAMPPELVDRFRTLMQALNDQLATPVVDIVEDDHPGFVYLAGPYRGAATAHDWTVYADIDANINEARRWAANMASNDIPYFCPHLNSAHMEVIVPDVLPDYWLRMDFEILLHATALFMLPEWRTSKGARAELDYAKDTAIPVYTHNMFERFVRDWKSGKIYESWKLGGENALHRTGSTDEVRSSNDPQSTEGRGTELRADFDTAELS